MAYFAQPVISDYQQTPSADIVALTHIDGTPCKMMQPPLFNTDAYAVPTNPLWVDQSGGAGTQDGSSYANRMGSTQAAIAAGEGGAVTGRHLVVCGPGSQGTGLAKYRGPFSNVTAFAASSKFAGMQAAPGAYIWFDGSDVLSGWTDTGSGFVHNYAPPIGVALEPFAAPGKIAAGGMTAGAGTMTLSTPLKGQVQIGQGTRRGFLVLVDSEWMHVSAVGGSPAGSSLTIDKRGCRGTTPASHASGASVKKAMWPMDLLTFDGVPYVLRLDDVAGPGEFWVDEVAGKVHINDDPTGHVVEVSARYKLNNGAGIAKAGFSIKGIGFQKWAGDSTGDGLAVVRFTGSGQTLADVVLAYSGWLACDLGSSSIEDQVVYVNNTMGKHAYQISNYVHQRYRVHHSNWHMMADISPSGSARFAGQKNAATVNTTDRWFLFDQNVGNGKWDDVRAQAVKCEHGSCIDNAGYGYTQEVGGSDASGNAPHYVDMFFARNGVDHGDNFRVSGVGDVQIWNITSVDSYGACFGLYEDSREYIGGSTVQRSIDPPGQIGDSVRITMQNCVGARTSRSTSRSAFFSVNGNVPPAGAENAQHGWAQTAALATDQSFASDPWAAVLDANDDHNVMMDLTSATGKPWQWAQPSDDWSSGNGTLIQSVNAGANTFVMRLAAASNQTGVSLVLTKGGVSKTVVCNLTSGSKTATRTGGAALAATDIYARVTGTGISTLGQATASAPLNLAGVIAIGHGNEANSKEILTATHTLAEYFPNLASLGNAVWGATIPVDGRSTAGATPPNWVADILGVAGIPHGSVAHVGAYAYPIAVPLNAVPNSPPTAAWDNTVTPANNGTVGGVIRLQVLATDDASFPVDAAELWIGDTVATLAATGIHLTQGSGSVWYIDYNTTGLTNALHVFRIRVTDAGGLTADTFARNLTVNNVAGNLAPVVTVTAPVAGTVVVAGSFPLAITAVDDHDSGPSLTAGYQLKDQAGNVVQTGAAT